jgi:intracellular multiplication protein IcmK
LRKAFEEYCILSRTKGALLVFGAALSWICYTGPCLAAAPSSSADSDVLLPSDSQRPTATPRSGSTNQGILIPAPPPASALSPDASLLAKQAEEAAAHAQTPVRRTPLTPEQARLQVENQAKALEAERKVEHNHKSFDKALVGLLPLSPDQIHDFMRRLEQTQKSAQMPLAGPPKGQVKITTLSLDPGVDPPQINLAAGYVTTIAMVDATGEPWPISDVGVGGNFEVSPTQAGSHVVRVMPLTRVGTGNISVLLKDLPTPIIFRLSAGGPTVDMRYDARIPKLGPGAKVPLISHPRLEAGDEAIMMLLDNAPPNGAKRMKVSGVDERTMAWMLNNHLYVRTPLTLLSPAWEASVSSADGMAVYEIGDAPVLLMSDSGAMVRARLSRDDDHDKQP